MDAIEDRISELFWERYNCSQIMMLLSLEMRGMENPELVRCMNGLSYGLHSRHVCGTMTAACCLLASYGDTDRNTEAASAFLPTKVIVKSFVHWFEKQFGSLLCSELIGSDLTKISEICPGIIRDSFEKCMDILDENGIDPEL